MLLTRAPLYSRSCPRFLVRLACVRHAASVDSEPGSNSRLKPVCLATESARRHIANHSDMHLTCCEIARIELEHHLTTGTFNLLSKTDSPDRTGRSVSAWMRAKTLIRPRTLYCASSTLSRSAQSTCSLVCSRKNGAKVQRADRIRKRPFGGFCDYR